MVLQVKYVFIFPYPCFYIQTLHSLLTPWPTISSRDYTQPSNSQSGTLIVTMVSVSQTVRCKRCIVDIFNHLQCLNFPGHLARTKAKLDGQPQTASPECGQWKHIWCWMADRQWGNQDWLRSLWGNWPACTTSVWRARQETDWDAHARTHQRRSNTNLKGPHRTVHLSRLVKPHVAKTVIFVTKCPIHSKQHKYKLKLN